jgi:hypothetical protein
VVRRSAPATTVDVEFENDEGVKGALTWEVGSVKGFDSPIWKKVCACRDSRS